MNLTLAKQKSQISELKKVQLMPSNQSQENKLRPNTERISPNPSMDSTIARRASMARTSYDIPDSFLNLSEVMAPPPVQNPDDRVIYRHSTLEAAIATEQDYRCQIQSQEDRAVNKGFGRRALVKRFVTLVCWGLGVVRHFLRTSLIWGSHNSS